ncbi:hypothetical protein L4X63_19320 [Geomonas sp. Red32]|uniref:hypothetical protein n=1 Tax=Geomonas sp. Red32 TaxID=2912856 RepID=UPI00202CF761|nr:hypothetical protein [Geomonas sp. Red32]MCM0083743.1 hypothetical protein [Geomonas sp. Red32]
MKNVREALLSLQGKKVRFWNDCWSRAGLIITCKEDYTTASLKEYLVKDVGEDCFLVADKDGNETLYNINYIFQIDF